MVLEMQKCAKTIYYVLYNLFFWKFYYKIVNPHFLSKNGKLKLDLFSIILCNRGSKIQIRGTVVIKNSRLILNESSNIILEGIKIIDSEIKLINSELFLGNKSFISKSNIYLKDSSLNLQDENRILSFDMICTNNSSLMGKSFIKFERQNYRIANIICDNSKIHLGTNVSLQAIIKCRNGQLHIGDNVFINHGTELRCENSISIGNNVFISYECLIFDTNTHSIDPQKRYEEILNGYPNQTFQTFEQLPMTKEIIIKDNVWIGMRAAVLKGVIIGENSILSTYTVVTKEIPANHLAYGNPSKIKILKI